MKKKIVYNITRFTATDFVGHLSCVLWFVGCNMRCKYCYNSDIVLAKNGNYNLEEVMAFLNSRVALLDSVVLSGGEATLHDLETYCKEIKSLGFKIKLDTNGSNLKLIKKLVENKLIDYVALDFKATKDKYFEITQSNLYDKFYETLQYLCEIEFDFELRTTYHNRLLNEKDIKTMIKTAKKVGYSKEYFIQNFLLTSSNFDNIQQETIKINLENFSKNSKIILRN